MGYTKLNYEDYQENIDYWLGSEGVELPLWASEISNTGNIKVSEKLCSVCAYIMIQF